MHQYPSEVDLFRCQQTKATQRKVDNVVDTVDPTVEEGSGSDGDADTVISEAPNPGAQADRSLEPKMVVSQVVPEVRPSART